ncbi:MAG: AsnC family transcriptional regulator, partial [Methanomassiliicoccales archaeon]
MDEVDFSICRSLFENSRQTFSALGASLGLTPQAVHKRVQDLTEANVIKAYVARPSVTGMGRLWVLVHGWSKGRSMKEVADRLASSPDVMVMMAASGNHIYVHGAVLNANGLASFVSFVQKEAAISDPVVGIINIPPLNPESAMTSLDMQILKALRTDSRRPANEVAEEIGISVKTAKKRIDRLQKEGLVHFSIHWRPDSLGDTLSNVHLSLKDGVGRDRVAVALIKICSPYAMSTYSFSNLPNQFVVT